MGNRFLHDPVFIVLPDEKKQCQWQMPMAIVIPNIIKINFLDIELKKSGMCISKFVI
jgi:hypothetical protein